MGLGRYENGRFHLIASLRFDADAVRIQEWRAGFVQASRLMFEATDGQHQLGSVTVCTGASAGLLADTWLEELPGTSGCPIHPGLGRMGVHATLRDERNFPFVILHELAHLVYDLFDEYETVGGGPAECIEDTTAEACIMDGGAGDGDRIVDGDVDRGRLRRFCVPGNHDPDGDTRQQLRRGHACWVSMGDEFDDLVLPAGLPIGADQDEADVPDWTVLAADPRFAVALDRSGSMLGDKLEQAKIGASWFIDGAEAGEGLALISFASTGTSDIPLHPVGPDRTIEHTAVTAVTAGGETAIGSALRIALDELNTPSERSSRQSIVLISDGLQTVGEPVPPVLADLRANLTRVFCVGVGDQIDTNLLSGLAKETGGEFARIDPTLPAEAQAFAIRTEIERLAALARDGGGVAAAAVHAMASGQRRVLPATVEPGASLATFLLSWPRAADLVTLRVITPSGRVLDQDVDEPDERGIRSTHPYAAVQIRDPEPGRWRTEITCRTDQGTVDVQRWAFVTNADLVGALRLPAGPVVPDTRFATDLSVDYGQRLAGLRVGARLTGPGIAPRSVRARADTADREADGVYRLHLRAPEKAGAYRLTATVSSDRRTRLADAGRLDGPDHLGQIPPFVRLYSGSVIVE